MPSDIAVSAPPPPGLRVPPYSQEAEMGVLGSILLAADTVLDLCIEQQVVEASFHVPGHRTIYEAVLALSKHGTAIDVLTLAEYLKGQELLEHAGGMVFLERLIDSTPTAAHAEFYIDIVRQKHLFRSVIDCAREAENLCYDPDRSADGVLSDVEQAFLNITERQHGTVVPWDQAVKATYDQIEQLFQQGPGTLRGLSTGLKNLDRKMQGLRPAEMIVLAARPSMGKTSLAMNLCESIALGESDGTPRGVGVFSLEMSQDALVMRMLCSRAGISGFELTSGYLSAQDAHKPLVQAASVLQKAKLYVDDTGGLDVLEMRARARRMKKKHNIDLIMIDYLQLLNSREYAQQGRQLETSNISSNIKSMAKELNIPVMVLSQLSRAPEQRDKTGKPKLSDLRDSGAIEQDADVVLMLRRPCKYDGDPESEDQKLAILDVAKHRNGPTGEVRLNFEDKLTRFFDRRDGGGEHDELMADDADFE